MAEFATPEAAAAGVRAILAEVAPARVEAYGPYPSPELEALLPVPRRPIPQLALLGGLAGVGVAAVGQWWITAVAWPMDVGGRPLNPVVAYVPVSVELGILGVVLACVAALVVLAGLPRLYDPLDAVDGFERASRDRFFVTVADGDEAAERRLRDAGAVRVTRC